MLDPNASTRRPHPAPDLDPRLAHTEPRLQPWCDPFSAAAPRSRFGGFERQIEAEVLHAMHRGLL